MQTSGKSLPIDQAAPVGSVMPGGMVLPKEPEASRNSSWSYDSAAGNEPPHSSLFLRMSPGPLIYRILITLPVAGLLSQWLLPLLELGGDSGRVVDTLALWAAVLIIQGVFTVSGCVWLPLNLVILILLCGQLSGSGPALDWVVSYAADIVPTDVGQFRQTLRFTELSRESRTLILLTGWAILVSAVQMMAVYRRTIWLFSVSTLVYLLLLELFVIESAYRYIAYTLGLMLLAQGMMQLLRLRQGQEAELREQRSEGSQQGQEQRFWLDPARPVVRAGGGRAIRHQPGRVPLLRWCTVVPVAVAIMLGAGHLAGGIAEPAAGTGVTPQQMAMTVADWAASLRHEIELVPTVTMTGYDASDAELGGPLEMNDALLFTASTPVPTYWRGDVYSRYDGRKWLPHRPALSSVKTGVDLRSVLPDWGGAGRETVVQGITFAKAETGLSTLLSGGSIVEVTELETVRREVERLSVDRMAQTIAIQGGAAIPISGYTVKAELNRPKEQELRRSAGGDPAAIQDLYLQLPAHIPERVRELAAEITSEAEGRYERVSAVEAYLERNYAYSLDTSVPPAGSDFVDDFLFESRKGYCSHFATAMTVLLRSEGIPARYVTGFAPGEPVQGKSGFYQIAYKDAHAWVEVYFPEHGWVAFDPTPGFEPGQVPVTEAEQPVVETTPDMMESLIGFARKTALAVQLWLTGVRPLLLAVVLLLVIPAAAAAVMLLPKLRLALAFARLARHMAVTGRDGLLSAAQLVLDRLQKSFGPLGKGQTMRQYMDALPIADDELKAEIALFASRWERAAYVDLRWSRTEKTAFLRQCIRIVKKLV
ncbi:transglutaminase-like domain-containing protein [Paenibacillus sp. FSL M8-0334]|uniref:transglutaminase-like domain-containing protein n=1 Tax=Paenibacillus sp. FSL M8-0334 TaxID=2921623 RepID=UPI0030F7FFA7